MNHESKVIDIEALGTQGIAFSVVCCDDPKTAERHTIHQAHAFSATELRQVMQGYADRHAEKHMATQSHAELMGKLAEAGELKGGCGCD